MITRQNTMFNPQHFCGCTTNKQIIANVLISCAKKSACEDRIVLAGALCSKLYG